jgi:glyoxylase-like metal-dependent hydrolase (beta-lactamase superfamily II)
VTSTHRRPLGVSRLALTVCAFALVAAAELARANPFEYAWTELAPGVWAAIRSDPFELPQEGNAVFVVTEQGVVLFDAGGSPAMGEAIVAKVRSVTSQPITHVVLSHWHGDHMRGLQSIQAAFPDVRILAHPHARDMIAATQDRWLKRRVTMAPNVRKAVQGALSKGVDLAGRPLIPPERAWLERGLEVCDQLDRENRLTTYVVPNETIDERLALRLGGREIRFLRLGNAHTAGDLILWLPRERIVATGDVVTAPIPLMPSAWVGDYPDVLARIEALGFRTLVPGHGAVQSDASCLDLMSETVRIVAAQMKELVGRGVARDEAVAKIDLRGIEPRFTHGDPFLANRFQDYLSDLPDAAHAAASGKPPEERF